MLHIHIFFSKIEYRGKQLKELVLSSLPYSSDITFFYLGSFLDDDKLFFFSFSTFLSSTISSFLFLVSTNDPTHLCSLFTDILYLDQISAFLSLQSYSFFLFSALSLSLSFIFYADGNFHLANSPGSFLRIQL